MAEEKIIINFKAVGNKELTRAIRNLKKATDELTGSTSSSNKTVDNANDVHTRFNNNLGFGAKAFATMRNNLLLFNFAMGLGIKQMSEFVKESAKIETMGRAFKTLSGGSLDAEISMKKLKEATDGTMSQFDLFQQANNAMILGVSKNSDEMAEMFDIAQRLGQALGKDTRSSVESLITGIGRQSRLMLDNIGIIVKSEEAYEKYAEELGLTSDSLTDTQKKQAFLNATMESARDKVSKLGEEINDTSQKLERLASAFQDGKANIGSLIINVTNLDDNMVSMSSAVEDLNLVSHGNLKTNKDLNAAFRVMLNIYKLLNPEVLKFSLLTGKSTQNFKLFKEETKDFEQTFFGEIGETLVFGGETLADFNDNFATTLKVYQAIKDKSSKKGLVSDALYGENEPMVFLDSLISSKNHFEGINKVTNTTSMQFVKVKSSADLALDTMNQFSSSMGNAILNANDFEDAISATSVAFRKALASMAAQMAARAALFALFAPAFSLDPALIGKFALTGGVAHKGGLIKDDGRVQRFATGGSVKGGDNVPILAQGGEYVMQRSAVQSIGIENLNRMNQGSGGSVTVNVSGNVMSQDYVEGELAEQIKEAIRKGNDFGVS